MFLCLLTEELCSKEGNNKTGCSFNFEHQCILAVHSYKDDWVLWFLFEFQVNNDMQICKYVNCGTNLYKLLKCHERTSGE